MLGYGCCIYLYHCELLSFVLRPSCEQCQCRNSNAVFIFLTIWNARYLWKLARSCKQVCLLCSQDPWDTRYCLSQRISKLPDQTYWYGLAWNTSHITPTIAYLRVCYSYYTFWCMLSIPCSMTEPSWTREPFCISSLLQGLYSLRRRRLISIGIPIINLRRSPDRLRFIMGIPIPVRRRLHSE